LHCIKSTEGEKKVHKKNNKLHLDFSPCEELSGWASGCSVYCRQERIIRESINYSEINRDSLDLKLHRWAEKRSHAGP